jgi:hypothetical protein
MRLVITIVTTFLILIINVRITAQDRGHDKLKRGSSGVPPAGTRVGRTDSTSSVQLHEGQKASAPRRADARAVHPDPNKPVPPLEGQAATAPPPAQAPDPPVQKDEEKSRTLFREPALLILLAVSLATGLRAGLGARRAGDDD